MFLISANLYSSSHDFSLDELPRKIGEGLVVKRKCLIIASTFIQRDTENDETSNLSGTFSPRSNFYESRSIAINGTMNFPSLVMLNSKIFCKDLVKNLASSEV